MKLSLRTLFGLSVILSLGAPAAVTAGDCPVCTSSADCPSGSFCVRHNNPVGCGDRVQLCCPGQACAVMGGRPSCEASGTCTVVSTPADAGASDVVVTDVPAATDVPETTDGPLPGDVVTADAVSTADGGTITSATSGCACHAGATKTSSGMGFLAMLSLSLIARRRR